MWQLNSLYVNILFARQTEKYPRGRRGGFAKALGRATGAGVRIPPSPPKRIMKSQKALFLGLFHFCKTPNATKVQQNVQRNPLLFRDQIAHLYSTLLQPILGNKRKEAFMIVIWGGSLAVLLSQLQKSTFKIENIKIDTDKDITRIGVYYMCIDDLPL